MFTGCCRASNAPASSTLRLAIAAIAFAVTWDGCHKPAASEGAAVFEKYCARCHIRHEGQASPAPALAGYFLRKPAPAVRDVENVIRNGRRAMPPFGARLSSAQVEDLVAYLKTL